MSSRQLGDPAVFRSLLARLRRGTLLWAFLPLLAACAAASGPSSAGAPTARAAPAAQGQGTVAGRPESAEAPLPVEPATRIGHLANGLRYYVRPNGEPAKRASLRLVVDAGSVLETDAQQGFAHFVEHMAFNGTRLFKKQELVDFTEKIGMRFGRHSNASTGFDETTYMFDLPTDDPAILKKGFVILQQIATDVTFDPADVNAERGVVIEEWRISRGAGMRVTEQILPVIFKGSKYAERLPIGKKAILEQATAEDLRAFYRRWYRPDLMALVAVGDFDPDKVEAIIKEVFGRLPKPEGPAARPSFPVPDHKQTLVAVAKDEELPASSVGILHKLPSRPTSTRSDYRRMIVEGLYHAMINERLDELRRSSDPPFLFGNSSTQPFVRSKDVFSQVAVVKEQGVLGGLEALTREVERVDRFGFTKGELARKKLDLVRSLESAVRDQDKVPSPARAAEMIRHFLTDEAMPGIEAELALTKELLPTISLEEMNRVAASWISEENRVLLVQAPKAAPTPSDAELLASFDRVQDGPLTAYVDNVSEGPLVEELPPPTPVKREKAIEVLGVKEWQLGNGARVVVKPTDFRQDQILFYAFSPGGHSLASKADYESAIRADTIVTGGGVGRFDLTELRKALAGKVVDVSPYIGELEEGFSGSASPDDLETLFQLVYLYFTAPRKDEQAFAAFLAESRESLARRSADPGTAFWDAWQVNYFGNHPRRQPPDLARLEKVSLDRALRFYKSRFAGAGDFTFVFVGNVELPALRAFSEKYLGALPGKRRRERWRDVGARPPRKAKRFVVEQGVEPKSTVALGFSGKARYSREAEHALDSAVEVLRIRLREILREDLGGTYGVSVSGGLSRRPAPLYQTNVTFSCAPDNVAKLTEAVFTEVRRAKKEGFASEYLDKVKAAQRRSLEVAVRQNGYWLGRLSEHYTYGTDPRLILAENELIDGLDGKALQEAASRYFEEARLLEGVLEPADPPAAASAAPPAP